MAWYVYILECVDSSFFTGVTTSLADRIGKHNAGKITAYTANRLPVTLVYSEEYTSRTQAMQAESAIRRMTHEEKRAMIRRLRISGRHQH
jgi:putative endonuclease